MDIKESDWKVFRKLREVALERYCERVLKEVRHALMRRIVTLPETVGATSKSR